MTSNKIRVGIFGGAGYAGGELLRILLRHPNAAVCFAHSKSQAGKPLYSAHPDLMGESAMGFTGDIPHVKGGPNGNLDVIFLCMGHGESGTFLEQNTFEGVRIIDLSQDFRDQHAGFVYGLPELQRAKIKEAARVANPGCFATAIELALLPLAQAGLLKSDVHVSAITGSTGAGQSLSSTTHFSWRSGNISVYKAFTHQHLKEIRQSLTTLQPGFPAPIRFIPYRGNFTRGILASCYTTCGMPLEEIRQLYARYYAPHPFTHLSPEPVDIKQVVNTNKCLLHLEQHEDQLLITSVIDNLTKGASGQAVQNMNLMFGLDEETGLKLKPVAFNHLLQNSDMKLFDVYPLYDIEPVRAEGSYVWDEKGNRYLDLYGGHAVISIGHAHPHYVTSLTDQLQKIGFYSNSVRISMQEELAQKLGEISGYGDYSLFLCNSGAEANENALKLASFHNGRRKVIAFTKAFHGRTAGAVAVTHNPAIVAPVNYNEHVQFLPFNDADALEAALTEEVCAVIVEGIQGVGGIQVATENFLQRARAACDKTGTVLILDSVQCGYGRSGKFFSHQYAGIHPDLITTAKGMGNGFPVGGVLISPKFKASHGLLGTTFGGNHLACAAAIAVLDVIKGENLIENAAQVGAYLMENLSGLPGIKEIRGRGLMIGIETEEPAEPIRKKLLYEDHIFTGAAGKHTIRLLPSLSLTKGDADVFLEKFAGILQPQEVKG